MATSNSKDTKTKGAVATSKSSDKKSDGKKNDDKKPASKIESENTDKAGKVTTSKK